MSETSASRGPAGRERPVDAPEELQVRGSGGAHGGLHLHEADAADPQRAAEQPGEGERLARREPTTRPRPAGRRTQEEGAQGRDGEEEGAEGDLRPQAEAEAVARTTALPNMAATPTRVTASAIATGRGRGEADPGGLMSVPLCGVGPSGALSPSDGPSRGPVPARLARQGSSRLT